MAAAAAARNERLTTVQVEAPGHCTGEKGRPEVPAQTSSRDVPRDIFPLPTGAALDRLLDGMATHGRAAEPKETRRWLHQGVQTLNSWAGASPEGCPGVSQAQREVVKQLSSTYSAVPPAVLEAVPGTALRELLGSKSGYSCDAQAGGITHYRAGAVSLPPPGAKVPIESIVPPELHALLCRTKTETSPRRRS